MDVEEEEEEEGEEEEEQERLRLYVRPARKPEEGAQLSTLHGITQKLEVKGTPYYKMNHESFLVAGYFLSSQDHHRLYAKIMLQYSLSDHIMCVKKIDERYFSII